MVRESDRSQDLSDADYARRRKTYRTYLSQSFKAPFGTDRGCPSRFIYKVFDEKDMEKQQENWRRTEYELGDRKQIRVHVAREPGAVREILIQKVPKSPSGSKLETLLKLDRQQSTKFIDLLKSLDSIPIEDEQNTRIDDHQLLGDDISDFARLSELYRTKPEQFKKVIQSAESANDVIALQHRRNTVSKMRKWLEDDGTFNKESEKEGGPEKAWQSLLEANPWILGVGLGGQLLTSWDKEKLEQITTGANVKGSGKRVDALLKTNGIVSSIVFAEIKHHQTKLLSERTYRSSCWAPSSELAGAVVQVQQSVRMAVRDLGEYIEDRAVDGSRTGGGTFITQPKAYLIVGSLKELLGSGSGPIDDKVHSFELFRRNITHPEIITFDELLARAEWHVKFTESKATEADVD